MSPRALSREEKNRLYQTKTHVLTHLDENWDVPKLARHALLGKRKLKEGFLELFGLTPSGFIHKTRMELAFFLLRHTDRTIKDIACLTGYKKINNFSRAFKAYFGVTPKTIRN